MSIRFFKQLAFKLMRSSLALAFLLGVVFATVQVYMDFRSEVNSVDARVHEIFRVTHHAAGRSVHLLDTSLAREVVRGMEFYPFIENAHIYDDRDQVMARLSSSVPASGTQWITQQLVEPIKLYTKELKYRDGTYEGRFTLLVNMDAALTPFYDRAITIFVSGFARNTVLALILMLLYHYILTRPLVAIASGFARIKVRGQKGQRIRHIEGHQEDELGFIVDAANDFIRELELRQDGLQRSESQLRLILDSSPNHIFALNRSGNIVFANSAVTSFYRVKSVDFIGNNYYALHGSISSEQAETIERQAQQSRDSGESQLAVEQMLTDAEGAQHVMQMSYIPFAYGGDDCVLLIGTNITDRARAEERIEAMAYFDALTGLPNRNMLYQQLQRDLTRALRNDVYGALFFIDLDDFKRINDTMGHSVGDEVLMKLSGIMQNQVRQSDTLARLGGDEFTLSLPDLSSDLVVARQQAADFAERLLEKIQTPLKVGGEEFLVGASIGIVLYPECAEDTESLLRFADTAMYQAKREGRNCYRVFEAVMATEMDQFVRLEAELRTAIKEQQLTFFLQPIFNAQSGELVSAEALVRWLHPERGFISPAYFIDFVENSGAVGGIDQLVLEGVCQFIREQRQLGRLSENFRMAVNISAKELHRGDFVNQVADILRRHEVPGRFIELEITERAALERLDEVVQKIHVLQEMGIHFALDDFGTGYSSLSYLKRLPVNKIKIDKSFINDLTTNPHDEALVTSIIAIAESFNLKVVAEGVEELSQKQWLERFERVWHQGYFYDRPLPADGFASKYLGSDDTEVAPAAELDALS